MAEIVGSNNVGTFQSLRANLTKGCTVSGGNFVIESRGSDVTGYGYDMEKGPNPYSEPSTTKAFPLGTMLHYGDKVFRYCSVAPYNNSSYPTTGGGERGPQAGANLFTGCVLRPAPKAGWYQGASAVAYPVGTTVLTVGIGSSGDCGTLQAANVVPADYFADGYLCVLTSGGTGLPNNSSGQGLATCNTGSGAGMRPGMSGNIPGATSGVNEAGIQVLRIKSHPATVVGNSTLEVTLYDPLISPLPSVGWRSQLLTNQFAVLRPGLGNGDNDQTDANATSCAVAPQQVLCDASNPVYFWGQTSGPCAMLYAPSGQHYATQASALVWDDANALREGDLVMAVGNESGTASSGASYNWGAGEGCIGKRTNFYATTPSSTDRGCSMTRTAGTYSLSATCNNLDYVGAQPNAVGATIPNMNNSTNVVSIGQVLASGLASIVGGNIGGVVSAGAMDGTQFVAPNTYCVVNLHLEMS